MGMQAAEIVIFTKKNLEVILKLTKYRFLEDFYNTVRHMHSRECWLQCNCTQNGAIMYPRLLGNTYSLVNHTTKGSHSPQCIFFTSYQGMVTNTKSLFKIPTEFMAPLLVGDSVATGNTYQSSNSNSNTHKHSRVHQFLSHALSQANLNKLSHLKPQTLRSLYFTEAFGLRVGKGNKKTVLSVKDITMINPAKLSEIRAYEARTSSKYRLFNKGIPVHANFIFCIDNISIQGDTCRFELNQENFCIEALRTNHLYPNTSGPRLLFISKVYRDDLWHNNIVYSHPIYSCDNPIFVDSNIERLFIRQMLTYEEGGLVIEKFMVPVKYFDDYLLPDFKLVFYSNKKKTTSLISEVMGMFNNEEYIVRKARLIPLFKKRFKIPVIEVTGGNLQEQCDLMMFSLLNKVPFE